MTSAEFKERYQLIRQVTEAPIRSFHAVAHTGAVVMVHMLDAGARAEHREILERVGRLEPGAKSRVLEVTEVDGGPVIVTRFLVEFDSLQRWLEEHAADAQVGDSPQPPAASGSPRPTEPLVPRPSSRAPAEATPSEPSSAASDGSAGEFTRLFRSPVAQDTVRDAGPPRPSETPTPPAEVKPPSTPGDVGPSTPAHASPAHVSENPSPSPGPSPGHSPEETAANDAGEFTRLFRGPVAQDAVRDTGPTGQSGTATPTGQSGTATPTGQSGTATTAAQVEPRSEPGDVGPSTPTPACTPQAERADDTATPGGVSPGEPLPPATSMPPATPSSGAGSPTSHEGPGEFTRWFARQTGPSPEDTPAEDSALSYREGGARRAQSARPAGGDWRSRLAAPPLGGAPPGGAPPGAASPGGVAPGHGTTPQSAPPAGADPLQPPGPSPQPSFPAGSGPGEYTRILSSAQPAPAATARPAPPVPVPPVGAPAKGPSRAVLVWGLSGILVVAIVAVLLFALLARDVGSSREPPNGDAQEVPATMTPRG